MTVVDSTAAATSRRWRASPPAGLGCLAAPGAGTAAATGGASGAAGSALDGEGRADPGSGGLRRQQQAEEPEAEARPFACLSRRRQRRFAE